MEKFLNYIRATALTSVSNVAPSCSVGKITSFDPETRLVIVQIHPATDDDDAQQTGWIPLGSPWVGNGWGMFASPQIGALCMVMYQEGTNQQPIGATLLYDFNNRPLSVQSGEFWLVHESGSTLKFMNDGTVSLEAKNDLMINSETQIFISAPIVNITGDEEVNITAPEVSIDATTKINLISTAINAGSSEGACVPLLKADSMPTVNLKGT